MVFMDKLQFQGHWNQLKGKIKERWGKLTDDDLLKISGKRDELVGKLQSVYGLNREKIDQQIREIENAYYSDELRNHWNQMQSKLKQKWNALTEDDIQRIKGKSDQLIAQLQERYHFDRNKAETEFHAFIDSLGGQGGQKEKVGAQGKEKHRS